MPERWERELQKLGSLELDEAPIRDRVLLGPSSPSGPPRRGRLSAGVVAGVVGFAAIALLWRSLAPIGEETAFPPGSWSVATVSFSMSPSGERVATLSAGDGEQTAFIGGSRSPDEPYPYAWVNPNISADNQLLEIPMGSELQLEGDVAIKELLYGDADRLDAGAGVDSGVIWSDQPDFSLRYFLPWNSEPERTYLKFFGTWGDGAVLDVYFEVRFVAPPVDLSDRTAHVEVTPEPMGAALIYGGQRMPAALEGGSFGNTGMTAELTGWDGSEIVAKVAAGSTLTVDGPHLVDVKRGIGGLPYGEDASPLGDTLPTEPGRYIIDLDVTWDDGAASILVPIEIVEAPAPSPSFEESPGPTSSSSVVIDIRRSSEETGDPEAIASFGGQEQWMCPDHWTMVNPDGTTDARIFDCGQEQLFEAPPSTPIVVSGDFANVNVSTRLNGEGSIGAPTDEVAHLPAGTVVTYDYEVTWDDGSEASFWLVVTIGGENATPAADDGIVVHVYGIGERSYEEPTATFTYDGETRRACTQDFEWTQPDGTTIGELAPDLVGCGVRATEVPTGTPIAIEAATTSRVTTTRTTTQFFEGDVGLVVTAEWPEGSATFIVPLTVAETTPDLELVVLDCRPGDQIGFTGPDARILPGGSAYIVGNLPGFERDDVVEQMTKRSGGDTEWSGVWQVVRDGQVVASVDWDALSGTACGGSGIGGT